MKKSKLTLILLAALAPVAAAQATTYVYQRTQPQLKVTGTAAGGTPAAPTAPATPSKAAKLQLSTNTLSFSGVDLGKTATQSVLVSNVGNAALSLSAPVVAGDDFSANTNCPSVLQEGGSCVTNVTFNPNALGERSGELRVTQETAGTVILSGFGQQATGTLAAATSGDFGAVGVYQSQTRDFTFTNTGNRPARVTASVTGPELTFANNGCGAQSNDVSVPAGGSCVMTVQFAPTSAMSSMSGTLTVAGDFQNGPATLALSGSAKPMDPEINKVVLLMHMDGSFKDSSPMPKAVTTVGSVRSNEAPLYGTGALGVNDTSSGLKAAGQAEFAFAPGVDFTIEASIKSTSSTTYKQIIGQWGGCANSYQLSLYSGKLGWERPGIGTFTSSDNAAFVSLNTWHHVAVSRQGSTVSLYLDGKQVASATDNVNYTFAGCGMGIGRVADQNGYGFSNGALDEIRVTRGLARYTGATYTVPSAAFPD